MARITAFQKRRRRAQPRSPVVRICIIAVFLITCTCLFVSWSRSLSSPASLKRALPPQLLSRRSNVKIQTDVRGNLGPASVLNQDPPGTDWIKDRWQAASDMHGTAIRGAHWVLMEFPQAIRCSHFILDWEAALSKDYAIEGYHDGEWTILFDTNNGTYSSREFGQSPGVTTKTPLHIIHNITSVDAILPVTRLRIWIRSSAHGWGVSLWQVDVYGWHGNAVQ